MERNLTESIRDPMRETARNLDLLATDELPFTMGHSICQIIEMQMFPKIS